MQPLVIAYHLIWTVYGVWLPTDPRGSSSRVLRNDVLADLGELHHGRKPVQPAGWVVREFYDRAAQHLRHPIITLDDRMVGSVAAAFAGTISEMRYTCYACAIMPDHVHLVIRKHRDSAEEMIRNLQRDSHLRLRADGVADMNHPVWGGPGWKVFLDEPDDIRRTIGYVERNPDGTGQPRQSWPFVTPYNNWPLHPGHSPNSPYARRLRGR